MESAPIEVVIVTRNSAEHIGPCMDSLEAAEVGLVVVDNGSTDGTLEIVRSKNLRTRIITTGENLGYGRAMNLGFKETSAEFVILSNPDVVFLENSILQLVEFLKADGKIGVTGPQQLFPDRTWQRSYGDLPGLWSGFKDAIGITTLRNSVRRELWPLQVDRTPKEVPYLDGAVLAVRRRAFLDVGGFDEAFFFYSEEADLCAQVKSANWKIVFYPAAKVVHVRGASSAAVDRSDRFIRNLVEGQSLLAAKTLPPWQRRAFARLQVCQFIRLGLMYRLLNFFGWAQSSIAHKIAMFDDYKRIWKEILRSPTAIASSTSPEKPGERKGPVKVN